MRRPSKTLECRRAASGRTWTLWHIFLDGGALYEVTFSLCAGCVPDRRPGVDRPIRVRKGSPRLGGQNWPASRSQCVPHRPRKPPLLGASATPPPALHVVNAADYQMLNSNAHNENYNIWHKSPTQFIQSPFRCCVMMSRRHLNYVMIFAICLMERI